MPRPAQTAVPISYADHEKLRVLLSLVNDRSQPNINALINAVRNVDVMAFNIKALGYQLARSLAEAIPYPTNTVARPVGLACKPCTQADIESEWAAHWVGQLHIPVVYHRKSWELTYVLQALYDAGHIQAGQRGLGFGCGVEPIPSYLAAKGAFVTMTDLPPEDARAAVWSSTNQHTGALEQARAAHLVDSETFARQVDIRYVDMNAIPEDLAGYDFCWSICALEHLGSIRQGLDFIRNTLRTLRPGGTAVHTTEFNINPAGPTIDNWPTVLFQRKHMEQLAEELRADGHTVAPFDFDVGDQPMDQFIDLPPWGDNANALPVASLGGPLHLKVSVDGFASTCFGVIITKKG